MVALLNLPISDQDKAIFQRFHDILWSLLGRMDREYLFGCYLLVESQSASELTGPEQVRYDSLLDLIREFYPYISKYIQGAGDYLCAVVKDSSHVKKEIRTTEDTVVPLPPKAPEEPPSQSEDGRVKPPPPVVTSKGNCFHDVSEPLPVEFTRGPIAGTLTYLAELICPLYGAAKDARNLKNRGAAGEVWIQKITGQSYKVFFKECDHLLFAKANAQDMSNKEKTRK